MATRKVKGEWLHDGKRKMEDPDSMGLKRVEVDPRVMRAAKAALLPGQRLLVVSETEVRIVNERTCKGMDDPLAE